MKSAVLSLVILLLCAVSGNAQDWQQASSQVTETIQESTRNSRETAQLIEQERARLREEKGILQTSVHAKQKQFDALKQHYERLLAEEKALQEELASQNHELKTIDGTIRSSAKQARDYFHESLTSPEFPEREALLDTVLKPDTFPGLSGIKSLLSLFLEELRASGKVVRRTGAFIGADGVRVSGDVLRVGTFTAAYLLPDGEVGFLRPGGRDGALSAVQGDPGWQLTGVIQEYYEGESDLFPVDISNGAALMRLAQEQRGVLEWLRSGGLLVWPILLVGLAGLLLVVERFFALSRIRGNSDRNMKTILDMVSGGKWDDCKRFCKEQAQYPTCRIIGHTLAHLGGTREIIENAFQEGVLKELPMLERFLPTLSMLGAVAPLLGLLGTVTGMINTFQIITVYGTGDPRMMSGGISEALITTQLGLAVAVPIMVLHHMLERRVDGIVGDMEEKGTGFAVALMKQGKITSQENRSAMA